MKKILSFVGVLVLGIVFLTGIASADLTKQDIEEIRKIIKEEIQHVDKRIDNLESSLNKSMDELRTEIKDVRT